MEDKKIDLYYRYSIYVLLLFLSGCSLFPVSTIQKPENWQFQGRFIMLTKEKSWHMKVFWQQQQDKFEIRFHSPLGDTQLMLYGDVDKAVLKTQAGQWEDKGINPLLKRYTGNYIPLDEVSYWLFAQPVPHSLFSWEKDISGKITLLQQGMWQIHYVSYDNKTQQPKKMYITHTLDQNIKIKLLIKQWQILP